MHAPGALGSARASGSPERGDGGKQDEQDSAAEQELCVALSEWLGGQMWPLLALVLLGALLEVRSGKWPPVASPVCFYSAAPRSKPKVKLICGVVKI